MSHVDDIDFARLIFTPTMQNFTAPSIAAVCEIIRAMRFECA